MNFNPFDAFFLLPAMIVSTCAFSKRKAHMLPYPVLHGRKSEFPRFPVELSGFGTLHAPFLTERRTRGLVQRCVAGNPGSGNG
jgi:hypothetical protein